jgi:hypothetical protein
VGERERERYMGIVYVHLHVFHCRRRLIAGSEFQMTTAAAQKSVKNLSVVPGVTDV